MTETSVIVVLSWFGRDDTLECVESLMGSPEPGRILVIDNGSDDGVLEAVAERWPEVATLQTGANLGFAGGMNRGIRWAIDQGAEYVTVLNNDTVVSAGTIERSRELAADRRAVSPEIYYRDHPEWLWFGAADVDRRMMFPSHVPWYALAADVDGVRATTLLAGCCITASAAVWNEVGEFDERFFLNFEDSEWSLRAASRGVELVVDTRSRILHAVSASFVGPAALLGTFYYVRNGLLFNRIAGGSARTRGRFLRGRVLTAVGAKRRAEGLREAARLLFVAGWAVACDAVRRYGVAPRALQRYAARSRRSRATQ